jgi:hypothetical protein
VPVVIPDWVVDAADVEDHHCLLRRIPDYALIDAEPDSSNFREKEEGTGLSVSVWSSPDDLIILLTENPTWGLTTLVVSDVRKLGLKIMRAPLPDDPNHCEIWGIGSKTPKKLKRVHKWACYNDCVPENSREPVVPFANEWAPRLPSEQ